MIDSITIKNFKSIKEQHVRLGAINVLIGGNGIGKSNFINTFELLRNVYEQQLQDYVLRKGGADCLLHNGKKHSHEIELGMTFKRDAHYMFNVFLEEAQDTLVVKEARVEFVTGGYVNENINSKKGLEANIKDLCKGQAWDVGNILRDFTVYHIQDTGDRSPIKGFADLYDNQKLRGDGSNIAPFLYYLSRKHPKHLQRIEGTIAQVAPFFDSFVLEPNRINPNIIRMEWKQRGVSDMTFNAYQLSDGTLRLICLVTLLLQPDAPEMMLIDEPELGMHPMAINLLCGLVKKAAVKSQVILSTQSADIVDRFKVEDIIVADKEDGASVFKRHKYEDLRAWLEDYSLGEVWEKNLIGGLPL